MQKLKALFKSKDSKLKNLDIKKKQKKNQLNQQIQKLLFIIELPDSIVYFLTNRLPAKLKNQSKSIFLSTEETKNCILMRLACVVLIQIPQ